MSIEQREPGIRRPKYNTHTRAYAIGGTIAGVGLIASYYTGYFISEGNKPTPIFDCAQGRGGSLSLDIPKGGAYSMESINGSSVVLKETRSEEVAVSVKDKDGNILTLSLPAKMENEDTIFEIDKSAGKDPYVVVNATCKPKNTPSPVPKASK